MVEKKNKRIKSIGHKPIDPIVKKENPKRVVLQSKENGLHVLLHLLLHQRKLLGFLKNIMRLRISSVMQIRR